MAVDSSTDALDPSSPQTCARKKRSVGQTGRDCYTLRYSTDRRRRQRQSPSASSLAAGRYSTRKYVVRSPRRTRSRLRVQREQRATSEWS